MKIPPVSFFASAFAIEQSSRAKSAGDASAKGVDSPGPAAPTTGRAQFDDYIRMSPAERMEAAILAQMGLSKDELAAMPPKERAAVEATIRNQLKAQMEAAADQKDPAGALADLRA